ncbi:lipopolysaccharide assembly protein LapB [Marinobacterium sediminicola]|uniref:Lipopolysaccharide assembly protein B n=1 Tax=Marinobacterium sediminicola TaxID=518898 RepID=A0ABY1S042_9GAMM|nr:lipopolysaccharide assembly protein LapB [Marinobacterium sediminicola]ULG70037.1 lipopolysaccharide assembly protein LapB [Marinobacterium sediminicola]SMR74491.1 Lipopolysaccharide biosynthesis regulator YciM, contains six TPR domains and a predicted metal-binding C-terminal domain [Marinobacterium sediminicola]
MLSDYLLIVPLFLAVGAGWWLGRIQSLNRQEAEPANNLNKEYFIGLDHLINENTDEAIESFIRALEINSDTIPAHLTLAKLFRRKGEVDRAVGIHQKLLARPDLQESDFLRIQMALARDYDALGLLDRSENLLRDIILRAADAGARRKAQLLLIKLYEKEREWQQALDMARELHGSDLVEVQHELAHYCCERAEVVLRQGDIAAAEQYLRQALSYDRACCRASLIRAKMQIAQSNWRQAIKSLKQVLEQDSQYVSETIAPLAECYRALGAEPEFETYLRRCLQQAPSATVIMALAEMIWQQKDVYAAGKFLTEELKKRPSIRGFNRLIDMHIDYGSQSARQSLSVLRGLTGQLELSKPIYQCGQCGFSGRTLHWQCPSCKQWGTIGPIQGLEGE